MKTVIVLISLMALMERGFGFPAENDFIEKSPEELGNHFEGDMQLTPQQIMDLNKRNGVLDQRYRWLKNGQRVHVFYAFQSGSSYTAAELQVIQNALNEIQSKTCITFVRRTSEKDFVNIYSGNGCSSYVGRIGGGQNLSLMRNGCVYHGIVIHEFMHALGFHHMQSSYDRDNYVRILYENIEVGREHNFNKYSSNQVSHFGTSYDLDSLMHYRANAFSRYSNRNTIETLNPQDMNRIGQRERMSDGDARRINNMYC